MMIFNDPMEYELVKAKLADLYKDQTVREKLRELRRDRGNHLKNKSEKGVRYFFRLLRDRLFMAP